MATGPTVRQSRDGVEVRTPGSCHATKPSCATRRMSALPRNHSSRAVDFIQSHRLDDSGSVRGAAKRLQPGFLVVQQAACAAAREVPVTPIAFLEPVALSQQPGCDATLRRAGELREGFE